MYMVQISDNDRAHDIDSDKRFWTHHDWDNN